MMRYIFYILENETNLSQHCLQDKGITSSVTRLAAIKASQELVQIVTYENMDALKTNGPIPIFS